MFVFSSYKHKSKESTLESKKDIASHYLYYLLYLFYTFKVHVTMLF